MWHKSNKSASVWTLMSLCWAHDPNGAPHKDVKRRLGYVTRLGHSSTWGKKETLRLLIKGQTFIVEFSSFFSSSFFFGSNKKNYRFFERKIILRGRSHKSRNITRLESNLAYLFKSHNCLMIKSDFSKRQKRFQENGHILRQKCGNLVKVNSFTFSWKKTLFSEKNQI